MIVDKKRIEKIEGFLPGLANRFEILKAAFEEENGRKYDQIEEDNLGPRKQNVVAIGVVELMKTLKPKKKRPIEKGKKQMGARFNRGNSLTPSL